MSGPGIRMPEGNKRSPVPERSQARLHWPGVAPDESPEFTLCIAKF
jgi:hypothetical protein